MYFENISTTMTAMASAVRRRDSGMDGTVRHSGGLLRCMAR